MNFANGIGPEEPKIVQISEIQSVPALRRGGGGDGLGVHGIQRDQPGVVAQGTDFGDPAGPLVPTAHIDHILDYSGADAAAAVDDPAQVDRDLLHQCTRFVGVLVAGQFEQVGLHRVVEVAAYPAGRGPLRAFR